MATQNITLADILQIEYLVPIGMTAEGLAERMRVPAKLVRMLLDDEIRVNALLANGLAQVFQTTPEFWIELQSAVSNEAEKACWQFRAA